MAIPLSAQTFTTLHSFQQTDGAQPQAGLVQATDGNLYGTTLDAGANATGGTIFKINPSGKLTTLYDFCSQSGCADGERPNAGMIQAIDANFYGTTGAGGGQLNGTVFKITLGGALTTLYDFCPQTTCTSGSGPDTALVQAPSGNLYGATLTEGANGRGGTIFETTTTGSLTTLYSFCSQPNCEDGLSPGGLVRAVDGNFYGVTQNGGGTGPGLCGYGCGTVFKMTTSGTLTTLYGFCAKGGSCADGATPLGTLVQGSDGNFYGTTEYGGLINASYCPMTCGTVFEISPSGTLTTLHEFCSESSCADGSRPWAGLILATDGNLYGTTEYGGANINSFCSLGCGTAFKITPDGTLTTLYSFCPQSGCSDGVAPRGALVQDTDGVFYGTTAYGGSSICSNGCGTIFSLSVGLGPFVETVPTSGKAGATVHILGTNLTGATSVTFNGTPATFAVVSGSYIKTTVPTGATTGPVQVTTPGGTLNSNVTFYVAH